MRRTWRLLLAIALVVGLFGIVPGVVEAEPYVLFGLYPDGALQNTVGQIQEVDTWLGPTGRRFNIAGDFMDLEFPNPEFNVPAELNAAWNAGYIPFVNISVNRTSPQIASGLVDAAILRWATNFAIWAKNGKHAFLGPLPEMNGSWTPYYGTPADFMAAYRHIRQLFAVALQAQGVPATAISWVFVPNGWGAAGDEFEKFYPGHNDVDIVAFSSYNYGGCPPDAPWLQWETFDLMFKPFLDRMSVMAPGKPIFISQTGVLDKPVHGVGSKDQWLQDSYTRLAAYPRLRGVVYFNRVFVNDAGYPNCPTADFRLHVPGTDQWQGFKSAAADPNSNFGYWAPGSAQVAQIVFAPTAPLIFADVFPIHPFAAEAGEGDFSPWIYALYNAGVTAGCGTNPLRFCPADTVTRAQMAVFILKAKHGSGYSPPAATGMFADVPAGDAYAPWIEQLAREGITQGCGPTTYCPAFPVTRAQMAVFLLKAEHGSGYSLPPARGTVFTDVPTSNPFAPWIEQLAAEGITGGCGGGNYCPDASVTRAQMAVFLVRTFHL